jgi:ubiquinone/menaquinone biosynthesis C-methylase UbiE
VVEVTLRFRGVNLRRLQKQWNALGETDPLWAIITLPEKRGGKWDPEELFAWGRDEIERLLTYVQGMGLEIRHETALDFGCGVGRLTQALADHFGEVHGVDIAPSMIRHAERFNRHGARCHYHVNTSDDLGLFEPDLFDFVYTNVTLQHMEPRYAKRYVVEFLRVMRPGAVVIFQVPSELQPPPEPPPAGRARRFLKRVLPGPVLSLNRTLRRVRRWRPRKPRMEMHGILKPEVIELLESHGGVVVDVQPDTWASGWTGFRYCVTKR